MKLWLKRTFVGIFGASVLLGGLSACSGHRHGWSGSDADTAAHQEKMVNYAGKKLDLTEAQKQRLTVLAAKLAEQRLALMGASKDPRADLQALLAGDKLDKTRAQALIDDKTGAIKAKSPEVIAAAADFYDSLTPAQQQQIRDLMNRRHRWGG